MRYAVALFSLSASMSAAWESTLGHGLRARIQQRNDDANAFTGSMRLGRRTRAFRRGRFVLLNPTLEMVNCLRGASQLTYRKKWRLTLAYQHHRTIVKTPPQGSQQSPMNSNKTFIVFLLCISAAMSIQSAEVTAPAPPPAIDKGIGLLAIFGIGVAGAACMYAYWFRTERIQKVIASFQVPERKGSLVPTQNGWKLMVPEGRLLFFDLLISILLGGVAAMVVAQNGTWKEAFFLGAAWNSIFARIAKGGEKGKS